MIIMLQVHMSSSESGLSEDHDPMAVVSNDGIASDPEPFALPDFGDDAPFADGIPVDDILSFPLPIHAQLIIGHPDGEHLVALIPIDVVPLAVVPLEDWLFDDLDVDDFGIFVGEHPVDDQGDGEVDDFVVLDIPPPVVPVIDISSNSDVHSVADSFVSVTSSAL
ncbi:hypothetical protein Hanom_Chr04g00325551 [Helianthus anomalus]